MQGTRVNITIPPGMYRNGSFYQQRGRWNDGTCVRWVNGIARPIGRFVELTKADGNPITAMTGRASAIISWRKADGDINIAIGTGAKLYAWELDGAFADITPSGYVAGNDYAEISLSFQTPGEMGRTPADNWTFDIFGEYLVATIPSDGRLFVWENNTATPAAPASGAPTGNRAVVVTPERFLVALGAGGNGRKVQWASQETYTTWTPLATNSAGDFELATKGRLMAGRRTREGTLLWTDTDLHEMRYIGGQLVFSFRPLGDDCGLLAPNAAVMADTTAYWMGPNWKFYKYDGYVQEIPCDVRDYLIQDTDPTQVTQISAMHLANYSEIWWFYSSYASIGNSPQLLPDHYVAYNYREGFWMTGTIDRTCGVDSGPQKYPLMVSTGGKVFVHEQYDSSQPGAEGYLQSGPIEIGNGDQLMNVTKLIIDEGTTDDLADVDNLAVTLFAFTEYGQTPSTYGPYTNTASSIEPYGASRPIDVRIKARFLTVRAAPAASDRDWTLGDLRLVVTPAGRR